MSTTQESRGKKSEFLFTYRCLSFRNFYLLTDVCLYQNIYGSDFASKYIFRKILTSHVYNFEFFYCMIIGYIDIINIDDEDNEMLNITHKSELQFRSR